MESKASDDKPSSDQNDNDDDGTSSKVGSVKEVSEASRSSGTSQVSVRPRSPDSVDTAKSIEELASSVTPLTVAKPEKNAGKPPPLGCYRFFYLLGIHVVLTIIATFPSGYTNATVNTAIVEVRRYINESYASREGDFDESNIVYVQSATVNIWFIMQIFGSIAAPCFADRMGRKAGFLLAAIVTVLGGIIQWVSIGILLPELFIVGRGLTAFAAPLCDTCLVEYILETSPVYVRGMFCFLPQLGYEVMCIVGGVVGMPSVLGNYLSTMMWIALIPEVLGVIFLLLLPDTPKFFMIMRDNRQKAMSSLIFFQGERDDHSKTLDEFLMEKEKESNGSSILLDVLSWSECYSMFFKDRPVFRFKAYDMFRRGSLKTWELRQAVLLGIAVYGFNLAFFPIVQSSTFFLTKSGFEASTAEVASTATMGILALSTLFGAFIIDRLPRRKLIIWVGIVNTASLLGFGIAAHFADTSNHAQNVTLVFLGLFAISFGSVLGPLAWSTATELVVQRHKSTAFNVCYATGNLMVTATNFAIIPLYQNFGSLTFLPMYVLPNIGFVLFIGYRLPETLGKETHQIVAELLKHKKSKTEKDEQFLKTCLSKTQQSLETRSTQVATNELIEPLSSKSIRKSE